MSRMSAEQMLGILEMLSDVDEGLVAGALPVAWGGVAPAVAGAAGFVIDAPAKVSVGARFVRFLKSGWGIGLMAGIVAVGVIAGVMWGNRQKPEVPPVNGETEDEITAEESGEETMRETETVGETGEESRTERETEAVTERETETDTETESKTESETKPETEPETEPEPEPETEPLLVMAEGLVYESNGDGTCTVKGLGTCQDSRIILPERSPDGDLVTAISNAVFYEHKTIREVHLPSGVISVPSFYNSPSLKRVKLSPSVRELDARCFNSCKSLEEVDFNGAAVTVIPANAFGSSGLIAITLPDSVTELPDFAFLGCKNLTSVICGTNLTKVGDRAFDGCKQLVEFRTASSEYSLDTLTVIGASAFRGTALAKVAFSGDLSVIGESAFQYLRTKSAIDLSHTKLTYLPALAFENASLSGMILPEGMTTIGYRAFGGCTSLASLTLPDSLTRIDGEAFSGCENLGTVRLGVGLKQIGERAFEGVSAPIVWCENPTIQTIGGSSFAGYLGTSLVFPDSVTAVGGGALADCPNLKTLQIPFVGGQRGDTGDSTDCFGYLFRGGVDVWDQGDVIPRSLKTVILHADGIYARNFMDAPIESIVLGMSVRSISSSGFEGVTTLRNVYFEGDADAWGRVTNHSSEVKAATLWLYSEDIPTDTEGHYWHYDENGDITRWPAL